jgi:hypothetical protein
VWDIQEDNFGQKWYDVQKINKVESKERFGSFAVYSLRLFFVPTNYFFFVDTGGVR